MSSETAPLRRALLSVSDKTGIAELAAALVSRGVELISSGGTAAALKAAGVNVTEVSAHTGSNEILGGRVKTLHPKIHGGILARRGTDDAQLKELGIDAIDAVIVNLYPFVETIARPDCSVADAIENIDIGGPTMLRAAAKNHRDVAVIVDPQDYSALLDELDTSSGTTATFRRQLAIKAFAHTAAYDDAIVNWISGLDAQEQVDPLPATLNRQWQRQGELRYGENPHQRAAFYAQANAAPGSLARATLLQGKALSYNNLADADAAWQAVCEFDEPACVIVKHANPCGVAVAPDLGDAYQRAWATDSTSAFGGIIAFNRELDAATAAAIIEQQFVEVIIACGVSAGARDALSAKKNLRLLDAGCLLARDARWDLRSLSGGVLVQEADTARLSETDLRCVSQRQPEPGQIADLLFAWSVVKMVKSNAIVFVRDRRTLAIGAGQMSRVDSVRIAARKAEDAGLDLKDSVMASDAFFPFADALLVGVEAGASAVIQPGGSMRDAEVIAAVDEAGAAMVLTGRRHFRH